MPTIQRTIHYYDLLATFNAAFILDPNRYSSHFQALFSQIKAFVEARSPDRYLPFSNRKIFMNNLEILPLPGHVLIKGKLLSVREDNFPQIQNMNEDVTRDIETQLGEGIVETTHFVIKQTNGNTGTLIKLGFEFNHYGAKIGELVYYLLNMGQRFGIVANLEHRNIVRNSLAQTQSQIGQISAIKMRVTQDNIAVLQEADEGIATALALVQEQFQDEYLTLEIKYNIKEARNTPTSNAAIRSKSIVNKLFDTVSDPAKADLFEVLLVSAEDSEKYNNLSTFDLLIDKVKDSIQVEVRGNSKIVVSEHMFDQMLESWRRSQIRI